MTSSIIWLREWLPKKEEEDFILENAPLSVGVLKAGQRALIHEAGKSGFPLSAIFMRLACVFLTEK